MPRPQKSRKISNPPLMMGMKPFGLQFCKLEHLKLAFEEYESLKLINYEMLSQDLAAFQMNVSRPTFTRIYHRALKSITKALVEGKVIEIGGGNFEFESDWFRCNKCFRLIEGIENHIKCAGCNRFGHDELINLNLQKNE